MRTIFLASVLMILINQLMFSQNQAVLDSASKLIEQKQYETAFQLLDKEDPKNEQTQILIKKTDLLTNYFVTSINHVMFALKNLEEDETVMDYRGKAGDYSMHPFDPDSLTRRLIKKKGSNFNLYRNLANYWFSVYMNYGDPPDNRKAPLDSVNKYSKLAISTGDSNYKTYYKRAFCQLMNDKYADAIANFKKSIQRNDDFAESHYNLAYAYVQINQFSNALISANRAFEIYEDSIKKAEAARMAGISLMELEQPDKAKLYLNKSLKLQPGNLNTLHNLLETFFLEDNLSQADSLTKEIFALQPGNPSVADQIRNVYANNESKQRFVQIMRQQLKQYDQPDVKGNIYFAMAKATMPDKLPKVKEYLLKAKDYFRESMPKDHYVFDVIDQALQQIEQQRAE
ncbi:MAG: tetratricopeptide repeat protein [Bacteroidales bacterium]